MLYIWNNTRLCVCVCLCVSLSDPTIGPFDLFADCWFGFGRWDKRRPCLSVCVGQCRLTHVLCDITSHIHSTSAPFCCCWTNSLVGPMWMISVYLIVVFKVKHFWGVCSLMEQYGFGPHWISVSLLFCIKNFFIILIWYLIVWHFYMGWKWISLSLWPWLAKWRVFPESCPSKYRTKYRQYVPWCNRIVEYEGLAPHTTHTSQYDNESTLPVNCRAEQLRLGCLYVKPLIYTILCAPLVWMQNNLPRVPHLVQWQKGGNRRQWLA